MNHKEASRSTWSTQTGISASMDEIKSGSLQRIADACELMANNHAQLIADRDMYERWYREEQKYRQGLEFKVRSLRGVITKLKRQRVTVQ